MTKKVALSSRKHKKPRYKEEYDKEESADANSKAERLWRSAQQATGNRQQATGNRQQATNYTHLLNNRVNYPIAYYPPIISFYKKTVQNQYQAFLYITKEFGYEKHNQIYRIFYSRSNYHPGGDHL